MPQEQDPEFSGTSDKSAGDEALLKEIRDNYRRYLEAWKPQHEHREKLMRYLCGDPWSEKDRTARANRPCISHDELNQYVFQCVNAARANKRGVKIEPAGSGATDKTAELHEDIVRTVEYKSDAPAIYLQAYQDEVEGGYGFCRISRLYINDDTDDQEMVVLPIPNPDSVLYDPDCKKPDWSDAKGVFVLDPIEKKEFEELYPDADLVGFTDEDGSIRQDWINEDNILRAEYWKLKTTRVKGKTGRMIEKHEVIQYITNGIQILEKNPQPGKEIPIIPFIGLQRWVKENGSPKRMLFGLASFALDPQMTLAYLCSQEMEEAGLSPKSPYQGYVGQFETDSDAWKNLTKIPVAFIQVDPIVDPATGQVLPLPQRVQFTPNFQAFEVAKESARRAIQAAIGGSPLPTDSQRQNQKSGVALQKINASEEIGSFHLVDGYKRAIKRAGRIMESWMESTYDTTREMGLHRRNDSRRMVTLNNPKPEEGQEANNIGDEEHDITTTDGPSAESQRQAAGEFVDLIVQELANLPIEPPQKAKILALGIKLKQLGPLGDEMAEIISPTDGQQLPPQAQAVLGKLQQQTQQLHAYAQQLEGQVQKLTFEKEAKIVEHAGDMELERLKLENDLAKAEVTTKAQSTEERLTFVEDMYKQLHAQAHDVAMAAQGQVHAQANAEQQAALAPQDQQDSPADAQSAPQTP